MEWSPWSPALAWPYATPHLPGCGGRLKERPEDFVVTEVPLYEASGQGEHVYLEVEKVRLSTPQVIARLREVTGLPAGAIGHAGLKDAQAVARQWFSLLGASEAGLAGLEGPGLRVLRVARHDNKLRRGHLRGNRFAIRVRGSAPPPRWSELVDWIGAHGFPNYFGAQRLGPGGENAQRGRSLLLRPPRRMQPDRQRFLINAYQAALFNALLAQRLGRLGELQRLLPGDLAVLHRNGASFAVDAQNLAAAQRRAEERELSASAPLFGYKVPLAEGEPGAWERCLLEREGLAPESFRIAGKRHSPAGERRPMREFAAELSWRTVASSAVPSTAVPSSAGPPGAAAAAQDVLLEFMLPAGTYATALLRELMKPDPGAEPSVSPTAPEGAADEL